MLPRVLTVVGLKVLFLANASSPDLISPESPTCLIKWVLDAGVKSGYI